MLIAARVGLVLWSQEIFLFHSPFLSSVSMYMYDYTPEGHIVTLCSNVKP